MRPRADARAGASTRPRKPDYYEGMARKEPIPRNSTARTHILDTAQRIVGAKGFASVGLNQILGAAGIPKGSFYYYFASKEAFGKDLLEHYFKKDLLEIDAALSEPGRTARDRLIAYWRIFRENEEHHDSNGKCLAVKLGAEVSDMSEDMRLALPQVKSTATATLNQSRLLKRPRRTSKLLGPKKPRTVWGPGPPICRSATR